MQKDCQARNLNKEDAMDGSWQMEDADKDWMMIRMVGGWVFLLHGRPTGSPGQSLTKGRKTVVVVVVVVVNYKQLTTAHHWRNITDT